MSVLKKLEKHGIYFEKTEQNVTRLDSLLYSTIYLNNGEIAQLAEELLQMASLAWQPIETAPKDGTEIDLWIVNDAGNGWRQPDAFWKQYEESGDWVFEDAEYGEICKCETKIEGKSRIFRITKATHWRPLPPKP